MSAHEAGASRRAGLVRPPDVLGVGRPRPRDCWQLSWWTGRGLLHGAGHGSLLDRCIAVVALFGWLMGWFWLLPAIHRHRLGRPDLIWYGSPHEDHTVWSVKATVTDGQTTWAFADHVSAHPGQRLGEALRAKVRPALLAAADANGVTITATAGSAKLARRYQDETPGLKDVGRALPRGRRLVRRPVKPRS